MTNLFSRKVRRANKDVKGYSRDCLGECSMTCNLSCNVTCQGTCKTTCQAFCARIVAF